MTPLLGWLLAGAATLTPAARVDAVRAVERARYAFVIDAARPFDEVYARAAFQRRVAREAAEESLLRGFGVRIEPADLTREFDRIEKDTKAPAQWAAIKAALGNDRRLLEESFCRPLVVRRALEARFASDPQIHRAARAEAVRARASLLAGETPAGAAIAVLDRRGAGSDLERLAREFRRPGDVSTIFERADRFDLYRLLAITRATWKVVAVSVPKAGFARWLERAARAQGNARRDRAARHARQPSTRQCPACAAWPSAPWPCSQRSLKNTCTEPGVSP